MTRATTSPRAFPPPAQRSGGGTSFTVPNFGSSPPPLGARAFTEVAKAPPVLVALVIALERYVVNPLNPNFARYYAGVRCIKYWASLRFDDARWVDVVDRNARGLRLGLARTKTSGPGRKITRLHAYVSLGAYYEVANWIEAWWDVRQQLMPMSCFLPLPSPDLESVVDRSAGWNEASSSSQALWRILPGPGEDDTGPLGGRLLGDVAGRFWTEHSERCCMASAAAALGRDRSTIDRLGRWSSSMSEAYVRTQRIVVERLQSELAYHVRAGRDGPDFLDENDTLDQLGAYLIKRGRGSAEVDLIKANLKYFGDYPGAPRPVGLPAGPEAGRLDDLGPGEPAPEPGGPPLAALEDLVEDDELEEEAGALTPVATSSEEDIPPAGYVISISDKGLRRLHHRDRCHRIPGLDYKNWRDLGMFAPASNEYDQICRVCWPEGLASPGQHSSASDESSDAEGGEASGRTALAAEEAPRVDEGSAMPLDLGGPQDGRATPPMARELGGGVGPGSAPPEEAREPAGRWELI